MKNFRKMICLCFVVVLVVNIFTGCSKGDLSVTKEFKKDQKITLELEEKKVDVYMPKNDLSSSDNTIMASNQNGEIINGKTYKEFLYEVKDERIDKIFVTLKDNTIIGYELSSGDYDEENFESYISKDVKEFEKKGRKVFYTVTENNGRYIYYETVPIDDDYSVIITIESFERIGKEKLEKYVDRIDLR